MQENVGGRWATPDQWEQHRTTITSLYRRHTLGDIIRIMQKEHEFYATPRMYKLRIHAWGLRKNLNFKEAKELLERMIDRQLPPDRDWHATLSQLHSYIVRLPPIKQATLMKLYELVASAEPPETPTPGIHAGTTTPSSTTPPTNIRELSLAAGCDLRRAEACVHNLRTFILGAFANAWWSHDTVPAIAETRRLYLWYQSSVVFQGALRRQKTAQAFQPRVLANRDPRLFGSTVAFVALVAAVAPEVGASALRFTAAAAGATHGRSHPYAALLRALLDLGTTAGQEGGDQRGFTSTGFLPTVMQWYYSFLWEQARPDRPLRDIIQQCRHAAYVLGQRSEVRRQLLDRSGDSGGGGGGGGEETSGGINRQISLDLEGVRRYMLHYSENGRPTRPKGEEFEQETTANARSPKSTIALRTLDKCNNKNNNNNNEAEHTIAPDHTPGETHADAVISSNDRSDMLARLTELTDLEQALRQDSGDGGDVGLDRDAVRQEFDLWLDRYCARLSITDS
ncbi:hypothetical protein PG985_007832 [Apiospora marii]|uniref:uncharacterized protein n=1 Tax=Apiospora marii TaxID=335849 RepID=UPI003130F18C